MSHSTTRQNSFNVMLLLPLVRLLNIKNEFSKHKSTKCHRRRCQHFLAFVKVAQVLVVLHKLQGRDLFLPSFGMWKFLTNLADLLSTLFTYNNPVLPRRQPKSSSTCLHVKLSVLNYFPFLQGHMPRFFAAEIIIKVSFMIPVN